MFYKKGVLKNFAKFTGKQLCQSLFFNKVAGLRPPTLFKKRLWHWWFLDTFFREHVRATASVLIQSGTNHQILWIYSYLLKKSFKKNVIFKKQHLWELLDKNLWQKYYPSSMSGRFTLSWNKIKHSEERWIKLKNYITHTNRNNSAASTLFLFYEHCLTHFMLRSVSIPPGNIRKPDVFWCFQGV